MATAIGNVSSVPSSAMTAMNMQRTGAISMYPTSENRPDPHEDQAGDQAVAKGKRIDRLQEVDL